MKACHLVFLLRIKTVTATAATMTTAEAPSTVSGRFIDPAGEVPVFPTVTWTVVDWVSVPFVAVTVIA